MTDLVENLKDRFSHDAAPIDIFQIFSRPVMALFDIQSMDVRNKDKDRIFEEVLSSQGPQDSTVIIGLADNEEFEDEVVDEIVGTFSNSGEIILVR